MKITINDKTFYVGWRYESPKLQRIMRERGMTNEDVKTIVKATVNGKRAGIPALLEYLEITSLPLPSVTHCIISGEDKVEIVRETVRKFTGDVKLGIPPDKWDREKARKFSLSKVLHKLFPEEGPGQHKSMRSAFWRAYRERNSTANRALKVLETGAMAD